MWGRDRQSLAAEAGGPATGRAHSHRLDSCPSGYLLAEAQAVFPARAKLQSTASP